MQYHHTSFDTFSLATVQGVAAPVFGAYVTVDTHTTNALATEAVALVYEELLLSGCQDMDRSAFLDHVNRLGASIDVTVTQGRVSIRLKSTSKNAKALITLFEHMLSAPTFAAAELKRAKTLITNQLTEHAENARARAHELLANALFANTDRRFTSPPTELQTAVGAVTVADLKRFHRTVLATYATASVVGTKQLERHFTAALTRITTLQPHTSSEPSHQTATPRTAVHLLSIPSKQNIEFSLGGPLPLTMHHPDYVPFVFGLNVLGKWGGFAGRLMSTVREKEGLTYGIYARPESVSGTETGYWRIMTFFSPEQATQGLESTLREITTIQRDGITDDEYTRFKTIMTTQLTLLRDNPMRALEALHHYHVAGFTVEEMHSYQQRFQTVEKAAIDQALHTYLDPASIVIAGAGPVTSVQKSLKQRYKRGIL